MNTHPTRRSFHQLATACACTLIGILAIPDAHAEKYFVIALDELSFASDQEDLPLLLRHNTWTTDALIPGVRVPEGVEAYLGSLLPRNVQPGGELQGALRLAVRLDTDGPLSGFVDLHHFEKKALRAFAFTIDPVKATASDKASFDAIRRSHYRRLGLADLPGHAWFRHLALKGTKEGPILNNRNRRTESELTRTFAAFSGRRAITENLALDRELILARGGDKPDVPVDDIEGITVAAIDWKGRLPEDPAKIDPLAGAIPIDQHALFAPSMASLFELFDLIEKEGAPVVGAFDESNPFRGLPSRYLAQMGLADRETLAKLPAKSIAVTGGDPFFPSGTDVALLFETDQPEALFDALVAATGGEDSGPPTTHDDGSVERNSQKADRSFSSHILRTGKLVAISNSRAQTAKLRSVTRGDAPNLAASEEFAFFRHRYPLGADESAFLFLSDATIRRWCGPRLRIGASRRSRAMAALAELSARRLAATELGAEFEPLLGKVSATGSDRLFSESFGSLGFVTPIGELDLDMATAAEKVAYGRWRRGYQSGWARVFDPIAVRLSLAENERRIDVTVLPLTIDSEYRSLIAMAGSATLSPMARRAHDESLLLISFAVDSKSAPFRELDTQLSGLVPALKVRPLAWVDQSVSIFLDRSFFWKALRESGDLSLNFFSENAAHIPLGARIESNSSIKLALFLAGLKGLAETSAPNLLRWETRKHGKRSYVAVIGDGDEIGTDLTIYYAALPKALLISLDEDMLKRAIDRELNTADIDESALPLAKHALLQTDPRFLEGATGLFDQVSFEESRRRKSWSALPILNQWRRHSKDVDPAVAHRETFGVQLTCPGGKGYRWNAADMTMESVAYGHPAAPRFEAEALAITRDFNTAWAGMGFEDNGLRVRAAFSKRDLKPAVVPRPEGKVLSTARALMPTRVGTILKYEIRSPNPEFTNAEFEILPPGKEGDLQTIHSKTTHGGPGETVTEITDEIINDDGLATLSEGTDETQVRYSKPFVELPSELVEGRTSVFEYAAVTMFKDEEEEENSSIGESRITPVGREKITVPAGTFDACLRVDSVNVAVHNGHIESHRSTTWYKEGIGVIKMVSTTAEGVHSSELSEHHLPEGK